MSPHGDAVDHHSGASHVTNAGPLSSHVGLMGCVSEAHPCNLLGHHSSHAGLMEITIIRGHFTQGLLTAHPRPPRLKSSFLCFLDSGNVAFVVPLSMETDSTHPLIGTLPDASQLQWEIHVEFNNGMWWAMPHDLSDPILKEWRNGSQQVSFVWDWGKTRKGSYRPDGAETSHNRYIIDFDVMQQRNIDNDRTRTVKVVAVLR